MKAPQPPWAANLRLRALNERLTRIPAHLYSSGVKKLGPNWGALLAFALLASLPAKASMTVLVGEPFGNFGTMMPVGHAALYLDRVCADGPLKVRMCRAGEPHGVVLARYHRIGNLDWLASPVMEFLYATDHIEDVPAYATPDTVWNLRQQYRVRYLHDLVPDGTEGRPDGHGGDMEEWWESAGVVYSRRVFAYEIATSREQDERFVAQMNARPNTHLYHLKKTNCADFAAELVNVYFPGLVHNDRVADFGLMTPKEVVRCLAAYGATHREAQLRVYELPQIPGSLRRSRPIRGGAEAGLKTKRYLFTLMLIQPEVPAALAVLYWKHGRWAVGKGAEIVHDLPARIGADDEVAQGSGSTSSSGQR